MSRDSSATYIHMHSPRLADLFEEFCRPPSATTTNPSNQIPHSNNPSFTNTVTNPQNSTSSHHNSNNDNMAQLPGHFLPFEEIFLPPHLMPVNPEDEDDVVPDMHAAFGINRALGQGQEGGGGGAAGGAGHMRSPPGGTLGWRSW
ncbi:hypothetical protein GJ744_011380 [Endocarpon pusillum]|uniref:Anaphase-promoting complex subunit 13 n=1 Tax=Endocarpon pusillum TaxID=364733 RepID=A0A8H7ADB4_9EURO|nr:hypothetical protein GJ744_011380 [Endocarpon pusillum]